MISSLAKRLALAGWIKSAELLLRTGSLLSGNNLKIQFHTENRWTHRTGGWSINDSRPDMSFDPEKHWKFIREFHFSHYLPKEKDIFIDVGAGIGMESLYLSRLDGFNGQIYAIESVPTTYNLLNDNVMDNRLQNIKTFNLAIADQNGIVLMEAKKEAHLSNSLFGEKGVPVKSLTMDQFLDENQIREISFLKVNIEGAEKLLIRYFKKIRHVRYLAIACHDFLFNRNGNSNFKSKQEVSRFLIDNQFDIYSPNTGVDFMDDWIFGTNTQVHSES